MRNIIILLSLSAAFLTSCSRQSDSAPTQPPADAPRVFLTNFGTLSPERSLFSVRVDESNACVVASIPKSDLAFHDAGKVTTFSTSGSASLKTPNWHPQTGWFAYIDTDERVWVYDGQTNLIIYEATKTNDAPIFAAYDTKTYPRSVPSEVRSRLSTVMQQLLEHEKK